MTSNFNKTNQSSQSKKQDGDLDPRIMDYLQNFKPTESSCLHDGCKECSGTGVKIGGGTCFHYISCNCQKCSPIY